MSQGARQEGYAAEIESFIRERLVDGYSALSERLWQRDYSSREAFLASVAGRREAWRLVLNPPEIAATGDVEVRASDIPDGEWLTVPLHDHLTAQGALVVPDSATKLVVFVHGLGSTPERVFGVGDPSAYDQIGRRLVDAGYGVLAPMNLIGRPERNRAQALCRLAGTTMEGLEFVRLQHLLDAVFTEYPTLQPDYALSGMSWGGLATQYWAPLDERVAVAASLGFFNHRPNKMVVQDARYGTFYDTGEDHAFITGLLHGFSDADLASLIAPRPFLVQHGKADRIGWWPQVVDEFERARSHWDQLGAGGDVALQLHEGGHSVDAAPVVDWLRRYF